MKKRIYYQPVYNEKIWDKQSFWSFMVYKSRKNTQRDFPTLEIIKYKEGDIRDPVVVDEIK